jgi:twitching motility two-component system response regulator PilG
VTLRRERIRVLGVGDGLSALAAVADKQPLLVLLDITLPGMDGYQICQVIKQKQATKHIPVVMLSGRDGFFDRVRGKLVGSNQYVTKPFDPAALVKAVSKHMPRATV